MAQSLGGVATNARLTLYPMVNITNGAVGFYAFDPAGGYNDPNSGSFYSFKVEEVLPGRTPTMGQAIITYRDLGQVTINLLMTGSTDAQTVVSTTIGPFTLGNSSPTGRLMTKIVGLNFPACQNPQLTIQRAAGAGPLSIAKVVLCGRVEVSQEFA
jgi:hypothetical protein